MSLVSVIISTYNSELFIQGRLENLMCQTLFDKLEIIIVNSGSQQSEEKIINTFMERGLPIKYIKTEQRETIYKSWNRAIKISSGKFITNANTDDRLRDDALEILSNYLLNNPEVGLVYADQYITEIPNQSILDSSKGKICSFPDFKKNYNFERCIIGSQPMWRASLHFNDNIWFDETLEVSGDHEFQLNISQKYQIHHLKVALGSFYKSTHKTNKEYENPLRNSSEVEQITKKYIRSYVNSISIEEAERELNQFKLKLIIPIKFFLLIRYFIKKLFPLYPPFIFHSVEFTFYFSSILYEKIGRLDKAIKVCKKYLRYNYSPRIQNNLSYLQKEKLK